MQFPILIDAPVSTRAGKRAFTLLPGGSQSDLTMHYEFLLELALAKPDDVVFTSRPKYIDGFNQGLGLYDMAIGSLRGHVGEDAANLLMVRLNEIGLEQSLVNELFRLRHGYPPDPLVLQHLRDPPSHTTLLCFVLSKLTNRHTDKLPDWVPTVDAALAPLGLRHHMTVNDIVVDASMVGRTPASPGLLPLVVERPVYMAYANKLEWLFEDRPDVVDALQYGLGLRYVFELGLVHKELMMAWVFPQVIDDALKKRGLFLGIGNLYDATYPLARINEVGFGLMDKRVIAKAGNCTLMALVMQTPEELGLTEDEAREGREFLAHQGLDFGRHLHDVIREVDY